MENVLTDVRVERANACLTRFIVAAVRFVAFTCIL